MKKSRRPDPLADLASDVMKARAALEPERPRSRNAQVMDFYARGVPTDAQRANGYTPPPRVGSFVKSAGPGGIVFDFGFLTGNPCADNATAMLNQFADPVQVSIAKSQAESISRAFVDYSHLGEHAYREKMDMGSAIADQTNNGRSEGVHPGWDQQLNKSLDQQVVEMVKREGIGADPGQGLTGDFNKSTMVVNGERIVGQSETDAAVIEMMKSMGADLSETDDTPEG